MLEDMEWESPKRPAGPHGMVRTALLIVSGVPGVGFTWCQKRASIHSGSQCGREGGWGRGHCHQDEAGRGQGATKGVDVTWLACPYVGRHLFAWLGGHGSHIGCENDPEGLSRAGKGPPLGSHRNEAEGQSRLGRRDGVTPGGGRSVEPTQAGSFESCPSEDTSIGSGDSNNLEVAVIVFYPLTHSPYV